jgi:hypothetical protein
MPETSSAVSQSLVEQFAKAFADFVNAVALAVQEAAMNTALSATPNLLVWQTKVLPMLEEQNHAIQKGVALFQIGETQTIVRLAGGARGLAKQLDGYPLDFAGPKHVEVLDRLETAVVVTAYQVCVAARETP